MQPFLKCEVLRVECEVAGHFVPIVSVLNNYMTFMFSPPLQKINSADRIFIIWENKGGYNDSLPFLSKLYYADYICSMQIYKTATLTPHSTLHTQHFKKYKLPYYYQKKG